MAARMVFNSHIQKIKHCKQPPPVGFRKFGLPPRETNRRISVRSHHARINPFNACTSTGFSIENQDEGERLLFIFILILELCTPVNAAVLS